MTTVTLHEGDNREHLRHLIDQGVRVHAVVTDPPYGLTSVVKRFGKEGAAPARHGTDGAFARASGGFMGKVWDGTGIERDPEFWRLIWEILLPGGFVFAFSGSRTGHWQACAMETAGFIMHPMHGWVYASGMPKAHDASKAIDKLLGVERPVIGIDPRYVGMSEAAKRGMGSANQERGDVTGWAGDPSIVTGPGSPEAAQWEGWKYGTQTQKPALEPIYLGQKPFSEKTGAANLLKHGVGAMNVDGCRVPVDAKADASQLRTMNRGQRTEDPNEQEWGLSKNGGDTPTVVRPDGRYPANLLHDGSPEVVALFPQSAGQQGDLKGHDKSRQSPNGTFGEMGPAADHPARNDSGSAARFFNSFSDGPDVPAVIYHAKATKADRAGSKHPTVKPVGLMEHLIRHVTPPGGIVLDPFAGSGTTAQAARNLGFDCILMEQDPDYAAFLRQRFALPSVHEDYNESIVSSPSSAARIPPLSDDILRLLGPSPTTAQHSEILSLLG